MDESIRDYIADLIDREIRAGLSLPQACEQALAEIKRAGRSDEVLVALGAMALSYFWRRRQHLARNEVSGGTRKVDARSVGKPESIFDIYECVRDVWKRRGDLTADDCDWLSAQRRVLAESNAFAADAFKRVAASVRRAKAKTVHDAFKARAHALVALFKRVDDGE